MQEAARYRELEHLFALSLPRDSMPVAWRYALRLMLLAAIIDSCDGAKPGAVSLLQAATKLLPGPRPAQGVGR